MLFHYQQNRSKYLCRQPENADQFTRVFFIRRGPNETSRPLLQDRPDEIERFNVPLNDQGPPNENQNTDSVEIHRNSHTVDSTKPNVIKMSGLMDEQGARRSGTQNLNKTFNGQDIGNIGDYCKSGNRGDRVLPENYSNRASMNKTFAMGERHSVGNQKNSYQGSDVEKAQYRKLLESAQSDLEDAKKEVEELLNAQKAEFEEVMNDDLEAVKAQAAEELAASETKLLEQQEKQKAEAKEAQTKLTQELRDLETSKGVLESELAAKNQALGDAQAQIHNQVLMIEEQAVELKALNSKLILEESRRLETRETVDLQPFREEATGYQQEYQFDEIQGGSLDEGPSLDTNPEEPQEASGPSHSSFLNQSSSLDADPNQARAQNRQVSELLVEIADLKKALKAAESQIAVLQHEASSFDEKQKSSWKTMRIKSKPKKNNEAEMERLKQKFVERKTKKEEEMEKEKDRIKALTESRQSLHESLMRRQLVNENKMLKEKLEAAQKSVENTPATQGTSNQKRSEAQSQLENKKEELRKNLGFEIHEVQQENKELKEKIKELEKQLNELQKPQPPVLRSRNLVKRGAEDKNEDAKKRKI
uniref:Centrosomal protein of 162 kDa n=1 Tax=Caenorhabditis tropicalis TaxID=1561998 RepID=A0A1I7TP07_9PELO